MANEELIDKFEEMLLTELGEDNFSNEPFDADRDWRPRVGADVVINLSMFWKPTPDAFGMLAVELSGEKLDLAGNKVWLPGIWGTNPAAI